jgi:antitoxin component of MazEF toxin-antitoxin module
MNSNVLDADRLRDFVAVAEDGSLHLPTDVVESAGLKPGDPVRVTLEDGELKLRLGRLVVTEAAREIRKIMDEEGVTLENLLEGLEEARIEVFKEHYGYDPTDPAH